MLSFHFTGAESVNCSFVVADEMFVRRRRRWCDRPPTLPAGYIARDDVGGLRRSVACQRAPVSSDQIVAAIGALPCMAGPMHHRRAAVVAVDRCRE